jgi:hypothetical protein
MIIITIKSEADLHKLYAGRPHTWELIYRDGVPVGHRMINASVTHRVEDARHTVTNIGPAAYWPVDMILQ